MHIYYISTYHWESNSTYVHLKSLRKGKTFIKIELISEITYRTGNQGLLEEGGTWSYDMYW